MGVIKQGIQGGFSGKVGPHVGSSWKGINVMRAMPTSVANPNTEGQQEQRSAFKQTSLLGSSLLTTLIKPYWDRQAVKMSGYNLFVKTNIAFASKTEGISYKHLIMSVGRMDSTSMEQVSITEGGKVSIHWDKMHKPLYSSDDDIAVFVILNKFSDVVYSKASGVKRSVGSVELDINGSFHGDDIHAYLFFRSPDGKIISKSFYALG